jgi:hypothetical protein
MNEPMSMSVPVPEDLLLRVAALVPLLQRNPNISAGGKVTFTSALCLALEAVVKFLMPIGSTRVESC